MKLLYCAMLLVIAFGSPLSAQCINCQSWGYQTSASSPTSIFFEETAITSVPVYQNVETTRVIEYRKVTPRLARIVERRTAREAAFDPECAIQGALVFAECRQNGGRFFGCLTAGVAEYFQCAGFETAGRRGTGLLARWRARRTIRKQARAMGY